MGNQRMNPIDIRALVGAMFEFVGIAESRVPRQVLDEIRTPAQAVMRSIHQEVWHNTHARTRDWVNR